MQLQKLSVTNFRGLRELSVDFDGNSVEIYGKNGTGKTTIANAIWWVLYGKALDGEANFTPKTVEGDGEVHNLNHSAELVVKTGDGVVIALKKVYYEKYTKQRGAAEAEFSGHTTDHFIDDVPVKEKEYNARVSDIIGDPARAKILSNVAEFAGNMKWEDRRRILLEVCGDVSDADVIAANAELAELPQILTMPGTSGRQYTIDEYIKIAKAKLAEIRKEKDTIPARIDEADRAIKELPENPPKDIDADIRAIHTLLMQNETEIAKVRAAKGDGADDLRLEIKQVEMALATAKAAHLREEANANAETNAKLRELDAAIQKVSGEKSVAEITLDNTNRKLAVMNARNADLKKQYAEINACVWNPASEICPTCNRPFDADKIEEARAAFNQRKSEDLEKIVAQGKAECGKDLIAAAEQKIETLNAEIRAKNIELATLSNNRSILKAQVAEPMTFEQTENYKSLMLRLQELKNRESEGDVAVAEMNAAKIAELEEKKDTMVYERDRLNAIKLAIQSGETQRKRIAELKAQLKTLAIEDETLQRNISICEKFDTLKMNMLDTAINSKFTAVKFRMFVQQLNGGIKKDCEVLVPNKDKTAWVPYSGGSNRGANANAGLEIISVLSRHWGQSMPVIVDNAESVSSWVDTDLQMIRLIVTRDDDKLRVVVCDNAKTKEVNKKAA